MENSTNTQESPARRAAVAGLAVVGFFALVFVGMILAIYAARFVPATANSFSSASAYLSSLFTPNGTPATLTAVPTTTVPFIAEATTSEASTILAIAPIATTTDTDTAPAPKPVTHAMTVTQAPQVIAVPQVQQPYGLPNLTVAITAVGFIDPYGNFIPTNNVLNSQELAIRFSITNTGTNVTGPWGFTAVLPTKQNPQYTYVSNAQPSLNPGQRVDYTLHLDPGEALNGFGLTTAVTADPYNQLPETNKGDNVSTAQVNVSNRNF